jgi:2-dehydropantoate 2-reductase
MMKIAVVGPGAMGCLFAAKLARSKGKPDVWLLDKNARRAKKICRTGITVEGLLNFRWGVRTTVSAAQIGRCDLVILFTKSYDTAPALRSIGPLLAEETRVLTLQNGLGNLEMIVKKVGKERALGGATAHGATLLAVGKVRHAGKGETVIGTATGKISGDLKRIAGVFNRAGIATRMSKNVYGVIWSKLIVNAGINALGAVTGLRNGELLKYRWTREILRLAVLEAARVAGKKKIKLGYRDPVKKTESVCRATARNICSMLQDVLQKKRTEIDYINGAVVREGRVVGVKTPVNEMLSDLVKAIEET